MNKVNVAVLGATGAVGREMLKVLEERNFPINHFKALASARSAGKELPFGTKIRIEGFEDLRVVEDRGLGNGCIDVFVPDHQECLKLGLMYRKVWVVE